MSAFDALTRLAGYIGSGNPLYDWAREVTRLAGRTIPSPGGQGIFDPRNVYLSETIGNDITGNGTEGYPFLSVGKAASVMLPVATCHLASGGYGPGTNLVVSSLANWTFQGQSAAGNGASAEWKGTVTSTGSGRLVRIVNVQCSHGASAFFTWDDPFGGHRLVNCNEGNSQGALTGPMFHATSNARRYAFLQNVDLTDNVAPYNVVLDDLPAGAKALLVVSEVDGMRCSIGAGWTVRCESPMGDATFLNATPSNVVWTAPMVDQPITILQSQVDLTAFIASTSSGYAICVPGFVPVGLPAGATTGDVLVKFGAAGTIFLNRKQLWAPPTITGLVAGVPTPYRQTAAGWAPDSAGVAWNQVSPAAGSTYNANPNDWVLWPGDVLGVTTINLPDVTAGKPIVRVSKGGIGGVTVVAKPGQSIFCAGAGAQPSFNVNDNSSFTLESTGTAWFVTEGQVG